jgi:hypothetical protein
MPKKSKRYAVRVPWPEACLLIPEEDLELMAKTGIDNWRKTGVPSARLLPVLLEFWKSARGLTLGQHKGKGRTAMAG